MTKGVDHYLRDVLDSAWVQIFSSSALAMNPYPYRLGRYGAASGGICSRSDTYILDSAIGDPSVTTHDILDRARAIDADWVVPSDVIGDPATTTDAVIDCFSRLSTVDDYDPTVIVPLQSAAVDGSVPDVDAVPDHVTHYTDHYDTLDARLADIGVNIESTVVGIGGIRDLDPVEQVRAVTQVRDYVGDDVFLHAFGVGATREWVVAVRSDPTLLDSLDTTSIARDVSSALAFDANMDRREHELPRGPSSTCIQTLQMQHLLYLLNYLMSPLPRESDVPTPPTESAGPLDAVQS